MRKFSTENVSKTCDLLIHGFTISFPFRKLHGFFKETQQFRVKPTRVMVARRRREAMV